MSHVSRRSFLQASITAAGAVSSLPLSAAEPSPGSLYRIAPFRFDVTPPVDHPLCGGWIKPVVDVDDGLEAIGFVLLGQDKPIVVCAVDWTGILNGAHLAWRTALAKAAGTTPDRVAVQCIHQHDAPFVCLRAQELLDEHKSGLANVGRQFFQDCLDRGGAALRTAVTKARPVTHVARGEARVIEVAGNRRLALSPEGIVRKMRGSGCRDPELIAMPEGLIDPQLKTVTFYEDATPLVACRYYATHPMSHYGQGHVSSDFVGLARKRRQQETPGCTQIYFTGASGNVAAGKYNDGSPEARVRLTGRIYDAMLAADEALERKPLRHVTWRTHDLLPTVNPLFDRDRLLAMVADSKNPAASRIRPAMQLAWMERIADKTPLPLSALHLDDTALLHLPAESFVEYQLRAQQIAAGKFVATAAYGDGGAWYIPTKVEYPKKGYEVSVANCSDGVDDLLTRGMRELLS